MPRGRSGAAEHVGDDELAPLWAEHVARYRYAAPRTGRRVLDVACGGGLGLGALAAPGRCVVAGDLDVDALGQARRAAAGAVLCRLDVTALPYRDASFDLITCFETVEHVADDAGLITELRRVVADDGEVLVSTPRRPAGAGPVPANPFHVREYDPAELATLLGRVFSRVELLGQAPAGRHADNAFWSTRRDPWTRARRLALKASMRLPHRVRTTLDRALPRPLFPGPDDFSFERERDGVAPVLLAICQP